MTNYINPWHKPTKPEYGPAVFETEVKPAQYRGYLIYQRIKGHCWDVVKDGQCVHQMAGPSGARQIIDQMLAEQTEVA